MTTISFEEFSGGKPVTVVGNEASSDFKKSTLPSPEKGGSLDNLKSLYGGGEGSIGQKLIKTVKQGGEELARNDGSVTQLLAPTKAVFRGVGDIAGTVFAPVGEAINKATGGHLAEGFKKAGELAQHKGGIMDRITNIPAVQEFATKYPNASEDFQRALNIIFLEQANAREPDISTLPERTLEQGKAVVDATKSVAREAKNIATDVKDTGVKIGEKIFQREPPKPVENVLQETSPEVFDKYATLAKKASESYKSQTPLEAVGERAQEALDKIQSKLDNVGRVKSGSITASGGKPVGTIVTEFRQGLESMVKNKTFVEGDTKLIQDLISKARKLGNNPNASQVDSFVDYAQDALYSSKRNLTIPVTDSTTGFVRNMVGKLNDSLKGNLPSSYSRLNDMYSRLIDIRNELNLKLGFEGEKGGALMKRVFSPSDAGTKQLFADVLKETGIDLTNEATLARYLMESVGDARQSSLLEQLKLPRLTKSGITDYLFDKATQRFNTPEALIQRAREMTNTNVQNPSQPTAQSTASQGANTNTMNQINSNIDSSIPQSSLKSNTGKAIEGFLKNPKLGNSVENVSQDLSKAIQSHFKSSQQIVDEGVSTANNPALIERTKINIADSLTGTSNASDAVAGGKFADIGNAIKNINTKNIKSLADLQKTIESTVRDSFASSNVSGDFSSLAEEAQKYKSAEEFVNSKLPSKPVTTASSNYGETKTYKTLEQSWNKKEPSVVMPKGSVVFRGGTEGVYHSADLGTAEGYAGSNPVNAVDISGKKLANFQDFTKGQYASDPNVDLVSVLKKAMDKGYDGLYTRDNYGEVILPTKSQLTDIYNKIKGK